MNKNKIIINSSYKISLSESSSDTYDAEFVICDFNPNKNDVALNPNTINDWIDTLKNKPLVGKIIQKYNGENDFSGHNMKIVDKIDENGNKYRDVEFDTSAFGNFYEVKVENIDNEDLLTAKSKIWKRFSKASEILKRRIENDSIISTSWEIEVIESHYEIIDGKNIKIIDKGNFIGHCLLGENVSPAYDSSKLLNIASNEEEYIEFSNAIIKDIQLLDVNLKESESKEEHILSEIEGGNGMKKDNELKQDNKLDISSMTDNDIYTKVRRAINATSEEWYYIARLYPYEYRALAYTWDQESEDDYVEFIYTVNSDETISIVSQTEKKMIFVDKIVTETTMSEKETKISTLEKELAESGKAITDLTKSKEELETQISELTPFKEKVDELEKAENERILSEKKEALKTFTLEDNLISETDIEENEDVKIIFSELTLENYEVSQEKIEVIKGRKALEKYKIEKSEQESQTKEVETSETLEKVTKDKMIKSDINNDDNTIATSAVSFVMGSLK